ncbi:MAG: C40 family peptidase [Flavobacteriales bacterium]|nr:C40 family peptidase [Flavobacteriales bacterium]
MTQVIFNKGFYQLNMLLRNHLSVIPLRAEASDRAEMTSQVLYGESVEVLDSYSKWSKVKCMWDGYQGWIAKEHELINSKDSTTIVKTEGMIPSDDGPYKRISPGSYLTESELKKFQPLNGFEDDSLQRDLTDLAMQYLNTPYLWGGRSCWGIDCSGLIQVCFAMLGRLMPRDAYQQAELGTEKEIHESNEGDIAFFQNTEGRINHVGIVLVDNRIIHSSGYVRIDELTTEGIVRKTDNKLSHVYKSIRRINI